MPTVAEPEKIRLLDMYRGLVEVSALINGITEYETLLSSILDVARSVFEVEASSLFLVDDAGSLRLTIGRGPDGLNVGLGHDLDIVVPRGQGISGWVLENNEPLLVADAYADDRFYRQADRVSGFRTRSILCVPLRGDDAQQIGVLQVLNPAGRAAFDDADLEAFSAYANLVATAIGKLRLLERRASQARVDQELAVARDIQRSFLPRRLPQVEGFDAAALYVPAESVGGDFYDVAVVTEGEVWFVIGDVSGKGIPASLLMAQAVSSLRLLIRPGASPAAVLADWNTRVAGTTVRGMFITAAVGRLRLAERVVELACAGHPAPWRTGLNRAAPVPVRSLAPVGILAGITFPLNTIALEPGENLVFFTDGLSESFDEHDTPLGQIGLQKILEAQAGGRAEDVVDQLARGEARHRGAAPAHDDLTILAVGFSA